MVDVEEAVRLKMSILMVLVSKTMLEQKGKYIVIVMQLVYHVTVADNVQVVTVVADNVLANAILVTK